MTQHEPIVDRAGGEGVLYRYARAWRDRDLEGVLACYADDFTLTYFGHSPLAGRHEGRDAAITALAAATERTKRELVTVVDVLEGDQLGAVVALERIGDTERGVKEVRRVLLYRVSDDLLRECWLYDEDQRFVDELWST